MHGNNKLAMGERIRQLRDNLGLSREAFAEMLNVSSVFLRSIECGQRGMSIDTLQKLCMLLNVSSDYILFGKEPADNEKNKLIIEIRETDDKLIPLISDSVNHTKRIIALTSAMLKQSDEQ